MAQAVSISWLQAAESSLTVARGVVNAHPRSGASRAYYACFAAAMAVVSHLDPATAPRRVRHGEIAALFDARVKRSLKGVDNWRRKGYCDGLADAYVVRRSADYKPRVEVPAQVAKESVDSAEQLVRFARGVIR
jgi:uncharacterized protein (UPF0332 family)